MSLEQAQKDLAFIQRMANLAWAMECKGRGSGQHNWGRQVPNEFINNFKADDYPTHCLNCKILYSEFQEAVAAS